MRFWPWVSGKSPSTVLSCSLVALKWDLPDASTERVERWAASACDEASVGAGGSADAAVPESVAASAGDERNNALSPGGPCQHPTYN